MKNAHPQNSTSGNHRDPEPTGDLILRSIAFMIDWTLISILTVILCLLYALTLGLVIVYVPLIGEFIFSYGNQLIYALVFIGYHGYFEGALDSSTPGKKICGLRVRLPSTDTPRLRIAILRGTLKLFSKGFMFLGFLPAFMRKDRRSLHDLLIHSDVLKTGEPHPRIKDFIGRNLPGLGD